METAAPTRAGRARWPRRIALLAVLALAFALRLAYGWPEPNAARDYDSRFGLANVEAILRTHSLRPVTAFHPTLSYLPQAVVLGAVEACGCLRLGTASDSVLARRRPQPRGPGLPRAGISPLGHRSCRILQALLGVAAIALVYRLAAGVLDPNAGLAAAAVLAFVPWHLWTAGSCNEEAGVFLAVVLVGLATLRAVERDDRRSYALAGLAIGAALATKLNAGPTALPLAAWALFGARRDRRRLALLGLAAAVALAVFLLLNPHFLLDPDLVRRHFGFTVAHYGRKAVFAGTGRWDVLASGLAAPGAPEYLGLGLALCALVGAGLLLRPPAGAADPQQRRAAAIMALFPLTYVPAYALVTRHVKEHNWLLALPFALVLALYGVAAAVRALRAAGRRRLAAGALALGCLAAVPVFVRGSRFVRDALVPPTIELAWRGLGKGTAAASPALVLRDGAPARGYVGRKASRRGAIEVPLEAGEPAAVTRRLATADVWILERATYRRLTAAGAELEPRFTVEPRWLAARGPALVVGGQAWSRLARQPVALRSATSGRRAEAVLAAAPVAGASHRSLRFGVVAGARSSRCTVAVGGAELPAHLVLVRRQTAARRVPFNDPRRVPNEIFVTERFPLAAGEPITIRCVNPKRARVAGPVEVLDWRSGG